MSCADIFALAEALDAEQLLHMPDNYYDDLSTRWSIDDAVLARMRELGILYDEDANGRYFQIYTLSINGLFFEIVQRDGYVHYGEANAPARIAAQQRKYEQANRATEVGETP
jgi:4-hydroxyphenylpyruvate dioxygenase